MEMIARGFKVDKNWTLKQLKHKSELSKRIKETKDKIFLYRFLWGSIKLATIKKEVIAQKS